MPIPSRTYQKASGMYYIRLIIPKKFIVYVNRSKIIYSLKTKDRQVAYLHALKINLAFEEWLKNMAIDDSKRFPELKVEHAGTTYDFNLDSPAEKAAYDNLVDSIGMKVPKAAVAPPKLYSLDDGFKSWKSASYKTYSEGTRNAYYPRVAKFIDFARSKKITDVEGVKKALATTYRDHINIEEASPLTVDNHTKSIKQFFDYLIQIEEYKFENPFANLHLVKKSQLKSVTDSYVRFRPEEISRLFEVECYFKRFKKPDLFYSPLIALTMGLRLEEVAQLRVTDIYDNGGTWVIDINENGDYKEIKTESSKRILPIPRFILKTNFLDYHEYVLKNYGEDSHLYPYLIQTKNGYGKNIGYNFTKHKQALIKVDEKLKTFHSLRKTLSAKMDDAKYPSHLRKSILGHHIEFDITDETYGSVEVGAKSKEHFSLSYMLTHLNQIEHELDFGEFQFDFESDSFMYRLVRSANRKIAKNAHNTESNA
jgi:integrase